MGLKMQFLHYDIHTEPGEVVQVSLNRQANVRLLDEINFFKYRNRQDHKYYGGLAKRSPINLVPPRAGHWHVVIDLGGYAGTINASIQKVSLVNL